MSRNLFVLVASLGVSSVALANPPMLGPVDGPGSSADLATPDAEADPLAPLPTYADVAGDWTPPSQYIVNGIEVTDDSYPNVVHLAMAGVEGEGNCTGSLIHPNWILTAAHCIDQMTFETANGEEGLICDPPANTEAPPPDITVTFGNSIFETNNETINAKDCFIHRDWTGDIDDCGAAPGSGVVCGDVALVELEQPKTGIFPMPVNDRPLTAEWFDLDTTFIGFGITRWQGSGSGIKREVDVPVVGFNQFEVFTFDGEHSTCQGDSGGPGVVFYKNGYVQTSIVSYGRECGGGQSSSMRTDTHLSWIESVMGDDEIVTRPVAPPTFRCSREVITDEDAVNPYTIGVAPFTLDCIVDYYAPQELTGVTWTWGDGTVETFTPQDGQEAMLVNAHEYATPGNFDTEVCFEGERPTGPWSHCVKNVNYVTSCAVPDVAFTVDKVDGRRYQMINQTDLSVYGCIYNTQWEVFEGDSASGEPVATMSEWSPEHTFENTGTHTVRLNVGGFAGTGAAQLTFNATADQRGVAGCSQTGGAAGGLGLLTLGLGLIGLRRRRD